MLVRSLSPKVLSEVFYELPAGLFEEYRIGVWEDSVNGLSRCFSVNKDCRRLFYVCRFSLHAFQRQKSELRLRHSGGKLVSY